MPVVVANRWVTFAAQSLVFFLVSAGTFSSLGVVLPAMVRELHWSWTQAGLGYTFLGLSCGLSSVATAALIRRIGVRRTLLLGTLMLVTGFGALALTHSVWVYLAGTLIVGLAFSLSATVPGTHVLTGLFERRSTLLGAYFTIGALGGVAGPLMYVALAPTFGWRAYWWVFVSASAVLGLFAAGTVPSHVDERPSADSHPDPVVGPPLLEGLHEWSVRMALATSQFYVIVGAYTMYLLINTTAHGFAVEHLTEHGISKDAAAYMLSVEALIGAGVSVIGGLLGERVKSKTLLIIALISLIAGMSALAWAHGNQGAQGSAWTEFLGHPLMLGYALGVGIGFGLSFVASTMLLLTYFGRRAYLELYSIMCLLSTAAALGPAVGGWARDTLGSFAGVFFLCALAAFIMLIATALMRPPGLAADRRGKTGASIPMPDRT